MDADCWEDPAGADASFESDVDYSYAYPEPKGYAQFAIKPSIASFHEQMGEFVLPYEQMRMSADPDGVLLEFLQSTYEAAADPAEWDRRALEVGPRA